MPVCAPRACGCSFTSESLSIFPDEATSSLIHIEQADFSEITDMQADIATLQTDLDVAEADIATLEASVAALPRSKTFTANISSAPVTSGTTTLVMWSLSIPAQTVAGTVLVWMLSSGNQSVGTDVFDLGPSFDGGTNFSAISRRTGTGTAPGNLISTHWTLTASTALTVSACAKRQSGTGAYAPSNDARFNKLTALWVPNT